MGQISNERHTTEKQRMESGYRITPMFEQYLSIKNEYPDAILFYRMGDFYELFFEDAVTAARELQIALTSRNKNEANSVPMCGVPWHAVESYTSQLLEKGYNIVICDQVEDPKLAKGLVKREVTRILTPGTIVEDGQLDAKTHNYLAAIFPGKDRAGIVWADISTGQWSGLEQSTANMWQTVAKFAPRELILPENVEVPDSIGHEGTLRMVRRGKSAFESKQCEERLCRCQGVRDLASLGLQNQPLLTRAAGALLAYLEQTQKRDPDHLLPFRPFDPGSHMVVDEVTERNLEIFRRLNGQTGKGTLRHVMDGTRTPMGGRLLEDTLKKPLRDRSAITAIQDKVAALYHANKEREALREALENVYDLERLSTRIFLNRALPKDFLALRNTLASLPQIADVLTSLGKARDAAGTPVKIPESLTGHLGSFSDLEKLARLIDTAFNDPAPTLVSEGGIFRQGFDAELDEVLQYCEHGEELLRRQQEEDQARIGQVRLKFGYNRVFGYYYEISKSQLDRPLPDDFVRRQTLVHGERYTTARLKEIEENILKAQERRCSLEYRLFQEMREKVAAMRQRLCELSEKLAHLDYWQGLAHVARERAWVRPVLVDEPVIRIQEGRHPVVEDMVGQANFVPNSFTLDEERRLCLLTGPNMAGKSTILRQVALTSLMAQTGSFVPAQAATLGIVDRLFSRVGASDNLAQGQSTFMVEMMETARILRQATRHSLVILDEIGRGTSTYDGLSLAWAVAEDLAQRFGGSIRTLFATHYHELTQLEGQIPGVFTMNVAIREFNRNIIFLHKLLPGPTDKSYGVEVARIAGVPQTVVSRARELLERLEQLREDARSMVTRALSRPLLPGLETQAPGNEEQARQQTGRLKAMPGVVTEKQVQEHPLVQILRDLDPESLTPIAALNLLGEWKKLWGMPEDHAVDEGDEDDKVLDNEDLCEEDLCEESHDEGPRPLQEAPNNGQCKDPLDE